MIPDHLDYRDQVGHAMLDIGLAITTWSTSSVTVQINQSDTTQVIMLNTNVVYLDLHLKFILIYYCNMSMHR